MTPQKRSRTSSLVALLGGLALAGAVNLAIDLRGTAQAEETYEKLKVFAKVLELVQKNYVEEVDSEQLIYGAIDGMLATLDPHSSFMPPDVYREMHIETSGEFGGLGIEITVRDGVLTIVSPIDDTPAFRAGVKAGDRILAVEGEETKKMTLQEAVQKMRGKPGTDVTITIERDEWEDPHDITVTRDVIHIRSVRSRMLEPGYGYVRLTSFLATSADELEESIADLDEEAGGEMEGLIIDLRNNPGGLLDQAVRVSDLFIDDGLIVYTKGRVPNQAPRFPATSSGTRLDLPLVVLVNEGSASASEIVAGALQDHQRAVIVGTRTFGKGSVQTLVPLPDDSGLRITTARYYTPNGRSIQNEGIQPDVVVELTPTAPGAGPRTIIREENLDNRLDGEGEADQPTGAEPEDAAPQATPEDGTAPEGEAEASGPPADVQLERALEILKSYRILERRPRAA